MDVQAHVGRQEIQTDTADPQRMAGLAALLDHGGAPWKKGCLPPLGHWLLFHPQIAQSRIGADGHMKRVAAGRLPAVDLPRRMWAGSRVRFLADIALGSALTRKSTVTAITPKTGRSGAMLFVTLRHTITDENGGPLIVEEQDIVYRNAASGGPDVRAASPETAGANEMVRPIVTDPVMLFRYSALTFNSHRIHYDGDFCREVEGYPGLVVHGPLTATLLLDHALRRRPRSSVRTFSFRGVSPLFCGEEIALALTEADDGVDLKAFGPGGLAMVGRLEFAA